MRILLKGSTGYDVTQLQSTLKILGYNPGAIDGVFGEQTESAVIKFQQGNTLVVDGIVGVITWENLQKQISYFGVYIVQPGDTFYKIAQAHNIPLSDLLAINSGIDPYNLLIGRVIQLIGITNPKDGAALPHADVNITWTKVPYATGYRVVVTDLDNPLKYLADFQATVSADNLSYTYKPGVLTKRTHYMITVSADTPFDPTTGTGYTIPFGKVHITIGESIINPPVILMPLDNSTVSKANFVLQFTLPELVGNRDSTLILTSTESSFSKSFKVNALHPEIAEPLPATWFADVPAGTYEAVVVYVNSTLGITLKSKPIRFTLAE
ncbi:peptidoglycan-binding protein [Desulfosporosinus acididurans]|uniref:peptidoglycan-binding protein n=1 Tax=Desulfosporosinus acididurans TaxID=476652 RepID=UPI0006496F46|nr:peptidoglycan-binding protein [Desulfosporosinus acididurans]